MQDEWQFCLAGCRCRSRNDWDCTSLYKQLVTKAGDIRASIYPALRNRDWLALKIAMPKLEPPYLLLDNLQISCALLKGVIVIRLLLTTQLSTYCSNFFRSLQSPQVFNQGWCLTKLQSRVFMQSLSFARDSADWLQ